MLPRFSLLILIPQFTGDGAGRDHEGYYWIRGRVDDVVNVSGHRLSTAEIEAALIEHHAVAEAAVVGINDELTGQAVNAFVAIKDGNEINDQLRKDMVLQVRKSIGPFAAPKAIYIVPDLPKTRSGKIMRRILRKILAGEEDQLGDTSTVCLRSLLLSDLAIFPFAFMPEINSLTNHSSPTPQSSTRSSKQSKIQERSKASQTSIYQPFTLPHSTHPPSRAINPPPRGQRFSYFLFVFFC